MVPCLFYFPEQIVKCARSGYLDTAGYILEEAENRCGRRAISAQTYRELILGFQSGGNKFLALSFLQRGVKMRVLSAEDEAMLELIAHELQRPNKAVSKDEVETIEQRAKQSYKQVVREIDSEKSIDRTSQDIEHTLLSQLAVEGSNTPVKRAWLRTMIPGESDATRSAE
mmetsp:Transcript_17900/g.25851  ORF Transcript_17900/g.25851 Transcript_17900/m.25851 type:complete len:170 (-) Transcript_17900:383-892(-)